MKERYVKPAMKIDVFSLSQTVATYCASILTHQGAANHVEKDACTWTTDDASGDVYFLSSSIGCVIELAAGASQEDICYNAPSEGVSPFGSW